MSIIKNFNINKMMPFISLLIMLAVFTVLTGGTMISSYNLSMLVDQTVVLIIACCGTIFVNSQGRADLSVGVTCAFAAVVGDLVYRSTGSSIAMILTMIAVGAGMGLFCGFLTAVCKVPSFMATLATLIGLRGIINYIQSIFSVNSASETILMFHEPAVKYPVLILIIVVCWYLFEYTRLGRECKAIGENEVVARYVGTPVTKVKIISYVISGITAAIAGIFLVARLGGTSTTMGSFFEMKVMMAIYVGGVLVTGGSSAKMYKAIAGAFVVMIIENGLKVMGYASSEISEVVQGVLLMVILFLTIYFEHRVLIKAERDSKKEVTEESQGA